jgi:hypothetical protein
MAIKLSKGLRNALLESNSLKGALANGIICIYSGFPPVSANDAETGTLLMKITNNGGAFTAGVPTNGINFGSSVNGTISKSDSEIWTGKGLVDGTAGYFRFYSNDFETGSSETAIRLQGTVGTSNADMLVATTAIKANVSVTVDQFNITMPSGE